MSTLEKLIVRRGGVLELRYPRPRAGRDEAENDPEIVRAFELTGRGPEGLAEALREAARLGASPNDLAAVCDEQNLSEELSCRVMRAVGIELRYGIADESMWTALFSSREQRAGAVPTGQGRSRAEAVRALQGNRA
jgi:hypothetical protein